MSMLLYKSCRPLSSRSASRIRRQLHGGWHHHHSILFSPPPPITTTIIRPILLGSLYPMISCYSTLAIQTTMSPPTPPSFDTPTTTTRTLPPSPDWLKQTRLELKKIQQWINVGKYEQALQRATSLPFHDDLLPTTTTTTSYSELLDPFAILLERRLQHGEWNQGIEEFGQLASIPGWGQLLNYNRRAIKAILVMHVAQGNWSKCESMLTHLHIDMTATTVSRMVTTLMDLKLKNKYAVGGSHIVWALEMFERKLHVQVKAEQLSRLVGYLGDRGLMQDAYRIYCWARREPSPRASKAILYLTMIHAAIINNDTAKAERIWHEKLYRGTFSNNNNNNNNNKNGFRPATLTCYNLLLNIYASQLPQPNLARVHRTYRRLLNAGHTPSTYTYTILIKAFVNVGKPDSAYQIYDTMIRQLDDNNKSAVTAFDSRTIHMLLRGWIEKREWHQVERFIQELTRRDIQLDRRAFNVMLQGFLRLDRRTMAMEHVLKSHGDWTHWKYLQQGKNKKYGLTSMDLWQLLTAVTGRTPSEFDQPSPPPPPLTGFVRLFEQDAFNQVSCKLFIKAFTLANDLTSANRIKNWMLISYTPILEKKPLI